MTNSKENDWLLNRVSNPTFSISDFKAVGLDATNTSLEDASVYKNIPQIQDNPAFQTDGKFDEAKFDNIYKYMAETYNQLADESYQEDIVSQATFHRDNIFAEPEQRRKGPDIYLSREANPLRQKRGVRRLNLLDAPTMSADEVAQTQKVLANPIGASNGASPVWHDSPNDSFWTDFWDTRVMAQWDEDGEHVDPISKELVKHKKGELKLNENGTYYYENLDGRDVYGRRVLSKLNTLTTDGSAINKYDFFDSDGIDKSVAGSLARNAISILPMFIPGISPWYIGAGIALETTKVLATLGKVFSGSDNKFLSSVEGFTKSLEPTTSEYGQSNAWSMENFINLAGDVFKQLYEQRWIFKYAPAIVKGNLMDEAGIAKKELEFQKKWATLQDYTKLSQKDIAKLGRQLEELKAVTALKAQNDLENYMKGYNKIGEILSKAYMTSITVQDAYGEAKEQGATDMEAALLTLGYAAGEYAIINSKLGEWILPELRMDKEQMKQVVKTLTEGSRKTIDNASKVQKTEWMKKIFKLGKDVAQANYSIGKSGLKATAANALGEGIEEVSEEVLYDFAKSVTNLGMWLAGSDTPPLQAWDNMLDRYGMSFVGGMLGGAMFDALPNLRAARQLGSMDSKQAMQQLVYMARNGKMNDFLKLVNKMELGNKYLSATKLVDGVDGKKIWAQGTDSDNQDLAAKSEVRRIAKFVTDTLAAQGATISDDAFFDTQTLNDLRFSALRNSSAAASYLQDYNSVCEKIVTLTNQLNSLGGTQERMENGGPTDAQVKENGDEATKAERSRLEGELKAAIERKEAYMKGELAPQLIYESLFEMSTAVSSAYLSPTLIQYAENKTGKKVTDIPKNELEEISKEYEGWKNSGFKDAVRTAASIHKSIAKVVAPLFQNHSLKYYESFDENLHSTLSVLQSGLNEYVNRLNETKDSESFSEEMSQFNVHSSMGIISPLLATFGTESEKSTFTDIINTPITEDYTAEVQAEQYNKLVGKFLVSHIEAITKPIINQGYINPELKRVLSSTLNSAYWYFINQAEYYGDENSYIDATKMEAAKAQIDKLKHSNIIELLDQFSLSTTDSDVKVSSILEETDASLKEHMEDLSNFNLNNERLDQIAEALSVINIFKAQLLSARVDNADLSNLYGMNVTINELDSEANLAELQSNVADAMMQDLEGIELRLKTFQKIIAANNAQKLGEQTRTANNKNILIYDRIKRFILSIPNDWSGRAEFESVVSSLSKLEEISAAKKVNLNKEERFQVESEIVKLDDAIYDFFKANSDKVKNPEALSKLISVDNFGLITLNDSIESLNSKSTSIDDNAIVWYIASRAAVRASDFYGEYRSIISDKIAPIPTQELATYLGYASILNGGVIENFCDAVNTSLKNHADSMTNSEWESKYGKGIPREGILDSLVSPRFARVAFIEGIPGSGKTTGVFNNLIVLLKKYHPEVLKNVWIVHATEDSAKDLAKNLGLDTATTLDREHYMRKISQEWKDFKDYPQKSSKEVDPTWEEDIMVSIVDDDIYFDDNNITRSNFKINEISEAPSLILIDEVSRHTVVDMDLTNRFSQKYGTPVVAAGDFDQSKAIGRHLINFKGTNVKNTIQLARRNFVRCPKLGVSMRANNQQVTVNLNNLKSILSDLRSNNYGSDITMHYYQDNSGLFGTKVYNSKDVNGSVPYSIELVKADIDLMISSMNPDEKIGFIYYDTDTEIYKLLSSATYKDRIDFKQGNSSQGLEGKYYIIDDSAGLENEEYWDDLYTGISRAIQGSIVLHTKDNYRTSNSNQLASIQDSSTSVSELSRDGIKTFSSERRDMLNRLTLDSKPTELIKREKDTTIPSVTVVPEVGLTSETATTVTDDGTKETVIITNNGLPTEKDIRDKTLASSEDTTPPPVPATSVSHTSSTKTEAILDLLMYTFPTFESGTTFDKKGNLIVTPENSKRLDSYFGLNRLPGIQVKNKETFDEVIGNLRSIIFNTSDKGDLVKKVKTLLGLGNDVYCTFAFKSSASTFNNAEWGRFRKDAGSESLSYMFSEDEESKNIKLKTLSIIIGEGTNDVLELPLAILPNPVTVFKNDKFKAIRDEYNEISRRDPSATMFDRFNELIKFIQANPSIEGGSALVNFLKVYTFNSNGIFYIEDNNWTLAGGLKSQGPTITNVLKGMDYEYNGNLKYEGKWITLDELSKVPGMTISKVKLSPKGVYTFGGKTINFAKPGHPFVFVSNDIMLQGSDLETYYYKQLEDGSVEKKVKLVYVVPPKASVKEYFDNLLSIVSGDKNSIKRIGNDFTAYRIINILSAQPEFEKSDLNYNTTAYEGIMQLIGKLNNAEGDTKAQMAILNDPVDIKGLNANITGRQALQNYLLGSVYPPNADNTSRVFKEANLRSVEHILGQNKIPGIFYNIQYDKSSTDAIALDAVYDVGNYSIDNNPFMVNGKIDSPSFYGNVSPLLETIVNKMTDKGSFKGSKDNSKYLAGHSRIGVISKPTVDTVFKSMNIKASSSVMSEMDIDTLQTLSKEQVLDAYRKTNHLVIPIGSDIYISAKSTNLDVSNSVVSDISQIGLNIHKFTLTLGNEIFSAELNLSDNEITLIKQADATTGTPLTSFSVNSLSEVAEYKNILSVFNFATLGKVQSAKGVEAFNKEVNAMRATSKMIKRMSEEIDQFEGSQRDMLKNLVDFLQSKQDEKARLNTTDNSCPITIKIKL